MYALKHLGCSVGAEEYSAYHPGWGWDIVRAANELRTSRHCDQFELSTFWSHFDRAFWANAPVSMDGLLVLAECVRAVGRGHVFILSRPTGDEACREGKHDWVRNKMPSCLHDKLILVNDKTTCASPTSLLIDDNVQNCIDFGLAGGNAITYPRPWNSEHKFYGSNGQERVIGVIKDLLEY
jgi:hypothetical protein